MLAALTVTALLAPESVAYAQIAGIPPQFGPVDRHPDAVRTAGLVILRPDGELFFANSARLTITVDAAVHTGARVLMLDLGASFAELADVPTFSGTQPAVEALHRLPTGAGSDGVTRSAEGD